MGPSHGNASPRVRRNRFSSHLPGAGLWTHPALRRTVPRLAAVLGALPRGGALFPEHPDAAARAHRSDRRAARSGRAQAGPPLDPDRSALRAGPEPPAAAEGRALVQFQRTCWWSSSRCSHLKCWCTRSMSSLVVNGPSGSTIARLPCNQRGSIGLSQGLFTGNRHTRIRTPPVRFTVRLCVLIHPCTAWLTCQVALSHTSPHTRLPSSASRPAPQARKSVVTRLTGRPSTKRSSTRSWSVRKSP